MKAAIALALAVLGGSGVTVLAGAQAGGSLLAGNYVEGEKTTYVMRGVNGNWKYKVRAAGIVKKDAQGQWEEQFAWSHLVSNGVPARLGRAGVRFRQVISLDPGKPVTLPNLRAVPPILIGPITDLATFYVDLWLARRLGSKLARAGDHAYVKVGRPVSWADGKKVILGDTAVDFDLRLLKVDRATRTATLLVRHVPPAELRVPLPAAWMREAVSAPADNWVQVERSRGGYEAAAGKETFAVQMEVSLANGEIVTATLENRVEAEERECRDAALTNCGQPRPLEIRRRVEISLKN